MSVYINKAVQTIVSSFLSAKDEVVLMNMINFKSGKWATVTICDLPPRPPYFSV